MLSLPVPKGGIHAVGLISSPAVRQWVPLRFPWKQPSEIASSEGHPWDQLN